MQGLKSILCFSGLFILISCNQTTRVPETSAEPARPAVSNLTVTLDGGVYRALWSPSVSALPVCYNVYFGTGLLMSPVCVARGITNTGYTLPTIANGVEYQLWVAASNAGVREGKSVKEVLFYPEAVQVLPAAAKLTGTVTGGGAAKVFVVLYPVNLGAFGNYDVRPTVVQCDAAGAFTTPQIPAGVYTVKAFLDLNGNKRWDGDWLSNVAEPCARADDVIVKADTVTKLPAMKLQAPVVGFPEIIYDENPGFVDFYQIAYQIGKKNIMVGNTNKGFEPVFIDEGFNQELYQWDTCFMMFWAVYALNEFPAMASLDNFYSRQKPNGFISRTINENRGTQNETPTMSDPGLNPPLYAWAEYNYYRVTGDKSRLLRALQVLDKYYRWIDSNAIRPNGMNFINALGAGMDNSPRRVVYGWLDITSQQAVSAFYLVKIARAANIPEMVQKYENEYNKKKELINRLCWNPDTGFYYDLLKNGTMHPRKNIVGFWPMAANLCTPEQAKLLVGHLRNTNEFYRPHLFPSLSADEQEYYPNGAYWNGGVWPPTDYMIVKGLENYGYYDFAREAALNHLNNMIEVYKTVTPNTIWELYSPENVRPGTTGYLENYPRPNFVGWSGLGPITMFIEDIIGIQLDAPARRIVWRVSSDKRHGIRNLNFAGGTVDLVMEKISGGKPVVTVSSSVDFELVTYYGGRNWTTRVTANR